MSAFPWDQDCEDWRALGACGRIDPDLWFAIGAREHRVAKRICADCPVRRQCLEYAMEAPVDHGIWGGLTERERRRWRRNAGTAGWQSVLGTAGV
ncbi:MAG: WhiB family transcriptional regulator [Actinomycetota bacterium]